MSSVNFVFRTSSYNLKTITNNKDSSARSNYNPGYRAKEMFYNIILKYATKSSGNKTTKFICNNIVSVFNLMPVIRQLADDTKILNLSFRLTLNGGVISN